MKNALGLRLNLNGKHVSNSGLDEENYVIVGTTTFVQRKDGNKPYIYASFWWYSHLYSYRIPSMDLKYE